LTYSPSLAVPRIPITTRMRGAGRVASRWSSSQRRGSDASREPEHPAQRITKALILDAIARSPADRTPSAHGNNGPSRLGDAALAIGLPVCARLTGGVHEPPSQRSSASGRRIRFYRTANARGASVTRLLIVGVQDVDQRAAEARRRDWAGNPPSCVAFLCQLRPATAGRSVSISVGAMPRLERPGHSVEATLSRCISAT
jgi:hypothetical protein